RLLRRSHRNLPRVIWFVVLSHERRRIIHVNVTAHPTAAWTAQQLREAWPWDTAPRFVIRDRDAIYGSDPRRVASIPNRQKRGRPSPSPAQAPMTRVKPWRLRIVRCRWSPTIGGTPYGWRRRVGATFV